VLGVIAGAVAIARHYLLLGIGALRRRFVTETEVRGSDMVSWFSTWLAHTKYGDRCRRLNTHVIYQQKDGPPTLYFDPGLGLHVFRHGGTWMMVNRFRTKDDSFRLEEWYTVYVLGSRQRAVAILNEAKAFALELMAKESTAYLSDKWGDWRRLGVGVPREISTVVLPGRTVADVVERIEKFLSRREWYAERGIPWRLGFLLEGPPRTGKTSLVRALSHSLGLPLYVLDIAARDYGDRELIVSLSRLPVGAIVLIEDIDEQIGAEGSFVTLSGLLNALDGPLASEGRILFVTTNSPERLDAALTGDGRLDVHVHFGYATKEQAREMFLRFFPDSADEATAFGDVLPEGILPPAAIQEHLIARSDDSALALAEAHLLARKEVRIVKRESAA
jgi:chaperone BCS1